MAATVGIRELRQNLSRYIQRVKAGEVLAVTERGLEVARLVPTGASADRYVQLAARFGATVPIATLGDVARRLSPPGAPAGTSDAYLAETRRDR